jgi:hypothetical protein
MSLVEDLTTKGESLLNREYHSIYMDFENLEKYPSGRPTNINCVATLELIKSAFISYSMTGRPIMFNRTSLADEMDNMKLGFLHIKNIDFTYVIDEPLVIQTAFNYFKRNSNDIWFRLMSQVNFNAAMPGLIWENCIVNFLRQELFESDMALSESKMFGIKAKIRNDEKFYKYKYLPEDFERPPRLLPYGDKCVGQIAVEFNTSDDYLKWLEAVSKWEEEGCLPEDFCPICFPPNTAGPDISIAFNCPKTKTENDMDVNEILEQKSYILNVQVKLRKLPIIKESFKTVEPRRMFMDKNGKSNPPEANARLCNIYKKMNWFDRNIRMIVVYPCDIKRKQPYQQTPGASRRNPAIPRVIIDMENADILFNEECQEWIKDFKKNSKNPENFENPKGWDCSDIEDEGANE